MCNSSQLENGEYEVIGEIHSQILDNNSHNADELIQRIYGYKSDRLRQILFNFFSILTLGIPYIIFNWYPHLVVYKYKQSCLREAEYVFITDTENTNKMEAIQEIDLDLTNYRDKKVRMFVYQHTRYIWIGDQAAFVNVHTLNDKLTVAQLIENSSGTSKCQQNELIKLYGPNVIEVEVKSYWSLFVNEVFNPFYVFQIFSIILWSLDEYYYYAASVFLLSSISVSTSLYQTKQQSIQLHDLVESSNGGSVTVLRGKSEIVSSATRLVPGDVLILPPNSFRLPCDALLLTGTCIVNESMLTGESVPVMKSPPNHSNEAYSTETHKRHTLFAGTEVIQTRFYGDNQVLAKVVRTGFYTSKGELVKSILFPKPIGFQFYKDAAKFVIVLFCIAAVGMSYCIWLYVDRQSPVGTIFLRTLDIITIVVPPALPAAMTAGTIYSQRRLKKHHIFCISPPRINVCGKLDVICFDKTGTLTEDGLDLYGVLPCTEDEVFGKRIDVPQLSVNSPLLQALAACHSLTGVDGELTGDPLDLKMFEATHWILEEPGPENRRYENLAPAVVKPPTSKSEVENYDNFDPYSTEIPYEIGLLRRFHFSSTAQSMGVIARILGQPHMVYYVKGAPEKVANMCKEESLPPNFQSTLNQYTSDGYRVIGLAYKKLERKMKWVDAQRIKREQIECDMEFLGLLVMQNSLKPETIDVLKALHEANIRMLMVTGDNLMTAMSVARACGLVRSNEQLVQLQVESPPPGSGDAPPKLFAKPLSQPAQCTRFACDAKTYMAIRNFYPHALPALLRAGTVFGRFGPDQKTSLIQALQGCGWVVGMCGDGANDCGALKAAHIGVSLSQAEASVAAPFTSREQNIRCVRHLALEGRCALSTSFAIFKYMALYSLIQFISILILYNSYSILGNMQFLFIDLVLTTLLALSLGRSGPAKKLTRRQPAARLASLSTVLPLLLHVALCIAAQLTAVYVLQSQDWFKPVAGGPDVEEILCWENTVVFLVSSYQYLILAAVYAKGEPFRQPMHTNYAMVGTLITMTAFVLWLQLYPWKPFAEFMEVQLMDDDFNSPQNQFRYYLLLIPTLHLIFAIAIEAFLTDTGKLTQFIDSIYKKKGDDMCANEMETKPWLEEIKVCDPEPC